MNENNGLSASDVALLTGNGHCNGGWGEDDARNFFQSYVPQGKNLFDIVVAYPVEYGKWVEAKRASTGILQAYSHAEAVSVTYLKLIRK